MTIDAWPFLIAPTEESPPRLIAAPDWALSDRRLLAAVRESPRHVPATAAGTAVRRLAQTGQEDFCLVYRVRKVRKADYGVGDDEAAYDQARRPLEAIEGLIVQCGAGQDAELRVGSADLDTVHAAVIEPYRAYWQQPKSFRIHAAASFPLTGHGDPVALRVLDPWLSLEYERALKATASQSGLAPASAILRPADTAQEPLMPPGRHVTGAALTGKGKAHAATALRRDRRRWSLLGLALIGTGTALALLFALPGGGRPAPTLKPITPACAAGTIQLIGSDFGPIALKAASAYMSQCKSAVINVEYGNSRDDAEAVSQVKQAVSDHSAQAGSMIAMYDGAATSAGGLTPDPVGVLIYSVVAHAGAVPGANISLAELKQLYTQPDGVPGKVAVDFQAGSATRQTLLGLWGGTASPLAAGSCPPPSGRATSLTSCTVSSAAAMLSLVEATQNAIGYTELYQSLASYPSVSRINIDNVAPTVDNVLNGTYKFWAVEHLYSGPNPTELATDFLDFLPIYLKGNSEPGFILCSDSPHVDAEC